MLPVFVAIINTCQLKRGWGKSTINNILIIDTEEIRTSNTHPFILFLPQLGDLKPNNLTNIFNNHLMSLDILHRKQSPIMNWTPRKFKLFLPCFKLIKSKYI